MTKNDQKLPTVPKRAQTCPKSAPKHVQKPSVIKTSIFGDFWRFSTFMTQFWLFRVRSRFEGGAKRAKNGQKCQNCQNTAGNHTQIARKTHQNGPKPPQVKLEKNDISHFTDILPKIIHLESSQKCPENAKKMPRNNQKITKNDQN